MDEMIDDRPVRLRVHVHVCESLSLTHTHIPLVSATDRPTDLTPTTRDAALETGRRLREPQLLSRVVLAEPDFPDFVTLWNENQPPGPLRFSRARPTHANPSTLICHL